MIVGGLDLALTKIGWARTREGKGIWASTIQPPGKGPRRLGAALNEVMRAMRGVDLVVIEGPSYGSAEKGISRAHSQGKMAGVIELGLFQVKPRPFVVEVAPTQVKLFATGHGFAKKEQMIEAAREHLGYGRHSSDEADASWLVQMAVQEYELEGCLPDWPEKNLKTLGLVKWPQQLYPQLEF